ncbi:hypothetical protein V496_03079 [Pseudogymnoascus sp. VKM F-4515 (FW-2607)]|nr:hypothetical protein V496_03079 [Pseudogymnoascus sp. VKM F-4515 (FW-2607)]KFY86858.1 hypothetical protein V498_07371 [Pseudogymnoascus sp. VKM F-4517 (FW-2822)]
MRLTHSTDSLPFKSDHWSHKHLTRSKGGGPPGISAICKRPGFAGCGSREELRWSRRCHFKVAVTEGTMGERDDDLDDGFEEDEDVDWDEFYASELEDEE